MTQIKRTYKFTPEALRKLAAIKELTGMSHDEILDHLITHAQVATS